MENKIILLDTSVLIDNFRKKHKEKSLLVYLTNEYNKFCISSVTEYEIYIGSTGIQLPYWENVLQEINVISFDRNAAHFAVLIQNQLKTIDIADLFIAATALSNNLPIATLNRKHFDLIDNLEVITNID